MEFCGIIAYYFQTSFLQSATGLETFLSFFKGRAFPSSSTYLSISSSISFLFSTWEENSSNMSVSRMARSVMAARYDLSSSEPAPSRLSSTSPTLSRSAGVTAGTMASASGERLSSSSCSDRQNGWPPSHLPHFPDSGGGPSPFPVSYGEYKADRISYLFSFSAPIPYIIDKRYSRAVLTNKLFLPFYRFLCGFLIIYLIDDVLVPFQMV